MTVFKYFFKILLSYKVLIIMYTAFLIFFGAFALQTSDSNTTNFTAVKPNVFIINNDVDEGITKSLNKYIQDNTIIKDIKDTSNALNDALFYRDISCIITIPKNYNEDFLAGKNPSLEIKSTKDMQASYVNMLLERYLNIANAYIGGNFDDTVIIEKIEKTLSETVNVEITSKLDTNLLNKSTFFYNFANYSLLAGCVCVIATVMSTFKDYRIKRRTIISSINYSKYNIILFIANALFGITLWLLYIIISLVLLPNIMFTMHGLLYIINSFVFTLCALAVAFLIGNLISSKEAINGIVNVVALGSSFLCGAFVPVEFLPDAVLKIAHILPSYWYIQGNEVIKTLEQINIQSLQPFITNIIVLLAFTILFIVLTNVIAKRKRKL